MWESTLEAALAECGLPFEIATTDCRSYPCAALLRVTTSLPEGEFLEENGFFDGERLERQIEGCDAVRRAFGWRSSDDRPEDAVKALLGKKCRGSESDTVFAMMAFPPDSPSALMGHDFLDTFDLRPFVRAHRLLADYECE